MIAIKAKTEVRILTNHSDEGDQMNQSEHTHTQKMLAGTEGWKTHAAGESLGCDITTLIGWECGAILPQPIPKQRTAETKRPSWPLVGNPKLLHRTTSLWSTKCSFTEKVKRQNFSHTWEKVFAPNENNTLQRSVKAFPVTLDLFTFVPFLFDWRRPKVWT